MLSAISIYRDIRDVPIYVSDQVLRSHGHEPTDKVLASAATLERQIIQEEDGGDHIVGRVMYKLSLLYPS